VTGSQIKLAAVQEARICLLAGAAIKDSADPADALMVLLSGPLSTMHGQVFQPAQLTTRISEQFGWKMSSDAVEFFVPKFRNLGWLKSNGKLPASGPFLVDLEEPETESTSSVDTALALRTLGDAFVQFAKDTSPINLLPPDAQEAAALLLRFVVDASTPIDLNLGKARSEEDYLCARFADHVAKEKRPEAAILDSLTAVGFLFRVAEELSSPTRKRRTDLKVVIDGPVILDLLGSGGPERANGVTELFSTLVKLGANLVTFDHCVDEAKQILSMILRAAPRDRYGPTGDALRKGKVHENVLRGLVQSFDSAVRAKGIQILAGDISSFPAQHQYFDDGRVKALEQIVNWHDEDNDRARFRDVDTTVLTLRRRAFHRTSDVFDSKFVCVTSNPTFAGSVRRFLIETNYYNATQTPPIITLKELAARAWIEVGVSDAERMSIPRSQLLLSCDRSLRLNRRVVEKAKTLLGRVNPEQLQQFELLLEVPRSARALMDQTLNSEKYVSGENIELLVEAAVEAAGREVAAKERERRIKDTSKLKQKVTEVEEELAAEREARTSETQQLTGSLATAEASLLEARERDESMLDALVQGATSSTQSWRRKIRVVYLVAALFPLAAFVQSYLRNGVSIWWGLAAAAIVLLGLGVAMDRPGAWLTKLIQGRQLLACERQLRSVSRHDLAEKVSLEWRAEQLTWY
jgi:hypothetical protein